MIVESERNTIRKQSVKVLEPLYDEERLRWTVECKRHKWACSFVHFANARDSAYAHRQLFHGEN